MVLNTLQSFLSGIRFREASQEERFHNTRLEWLHRKILPISVLVAAVFIAFIPFDNIFAAPNRAALAVARVCTALALLAAGWVAHTRPARLPAHLATCMIAGLIYLGVFWTRYIVGLESQYRFTEAIMVIQVGVWFLGGMSFVAATIVNLLGIAVFTCVEIAVGEPLHHVWLSDLYLSALGWISAFAAWNIENLFRVNFADKEELEVQRHEYRVRAMRDGLTGMWNRRGMEERLAAALPRSARVEMKGAVLLIDLDRFKPVNDQFGHQAGDEVLVGVARRISSAVRPGDAAGRIGGDEFLVLAEDLPDEAAARTLAERVRAKVETPIRVRIRGDSASTEVSVGASIGICIFQGEELTIEGILGIADQAMYQDKSARRGAKR